MRMILACLFAAALSMSLVACGSQSPTADYPNATLTGLVQEVDDDNVTLLLGELETNQREGSDLPPGGEQSPSGSVGTIDDMIMGDTPFEGGVTTFAAGKDTITLQVSEAALEDLSGVQTGDVIQVETNETSEVVTISVIHMDIGTDGSIGGGSGSVEQGTAACILALDGEFRDETYASTGDDENALRVDGVSVTLDSISIVKSEGICTNVESGDLYGMNAALLAVNSADVSILGSHVVSSAQNGNGVFSYGEGAVINISDSVIETNADYSGGIQTAASGTINASNLTITTQGRSSAAIRSALGGGTVRVEGGTYTTNGFSSPAVYSAADIAVSNASLTANNAEALVLEGRNTISLTGCAVSGNMNSVNGSSSDINVHNILIYQSLSEAAAAGTSKLSMTGGTLIGNNGDMFYITNTEAVIILNGVKLINNDDHGVLLRVAGNDASLGWGAPGTNGGQATVTAADQVLEGDIIVDSISALDLILSDGSSFTGALRIVENAEGGTALNGNAAVRIEEGSTWTLTGDSLVTSLDNQGTINYNGHTITLGDGTVLRG